MAKGSKDVLSEIKKRTGKAISPSAVNKLAGKVGPSTLSNETELRKLIKSVAAMAKVNVSESTVNDIVKAVKASGMSTSSMESVIKMMLKK